MSSSSQGIARPSDENGELVRPSPEVPHTNDDMPATWGELKKIRLLSKLYCLEMGRGFRFLKKRKDNKFTTQQQKDINLLLNKYKIMNTVFWLNNK